MVARREHGILDELKIDVKDKCDLGLSQGQLLPVYAGIHAIIIIITVVVVIVVVAAATGAVKAAVVGNAIVGAEVHGNRCVMMMLVVIAQEHGDASS